MREGTLCSSGTIIGYNMELSNEDKIKRFHYEEILLILYICASEISQYDEDSLVLFAEVIEGRVEDLFVVEYLIGLHKFLQLNEDILEDFERLREIITGIYSSQWHTKMNSQDPQWSKANSLAKKILQDINVVFVEPNSFKDDEKH